MEGREHNQPPEEFAGEVLSHSEGRTKIEKLPFMPEDPKIALKIAERAKKRKKAEWNDGQCSACGRKVPLANFCNQCSPLRPTTFLTEDEIGQLERFGKSEK